MFWIKKKQFTSILIYNTHNIHLDRLSYDTLFTTLFIESISNIKVLNFNKNIKQHSIKHNDINYIIVI